MHTRKVMYGCSKRRKRKHKKSKIHRSKYKSRKGGSKVILNPNPVPVQFDPQRQMKLDDSKGGGLMQPEPSNKVGGGFMPQDLVNLGRDIAFNMNSTYNALTAQKAPVNPSPIYQPITNKHS